MNNRRSLSRHFSLKALACLALAMGACAEPPPPVAPEPAPAPEEAAPAPEPQMDPKLVFEAEVADYVRKFPYQDTYDYAMKYTGGDASKLNTWILPEKAMIVKAGDDKVVRMNNDTFYNMAFLDLDHGPVILESNAPSHDRFFSFQLMDDHNVNYHNVIHPKGKFTLYRGEKPDGIEGTAIEVPTALSVVIVRVEVKNQDDKKDFKAAEAVFDGIKIQGPTIKELAKVDLLSPFSKEVQKEALARIESTFREKALRELVPSIGDEIGKDISFLNLAAGTKGGWGGPDPMHSAYETIFTDTEGKKMMGSLGTYSFTTEAPPVDAFWSVTVYDTERGGFLHPNDANRYHFNGTTATIGKDKKYSFLFKQKCEKADVNCLEVPAGAFDLATRYYLPHEEVISGKWEVPRPSLQK